MRPMLSASDRRQVREARRPAEEQMEFNNDNEQVERNKLRKPITIFSFPEKIFGFPKTIPKLSNTSKGDASTEPSRLPH